MKKKKFTLLFLLAVMGIACNGCNHGLSIQNLQVEMRSNPLGLNLHQPRLSWQIAATMNNVKQTAYQTRVAESPENIKKENDLSWNSGKV